MSGKKEGESSPGGDGKPTDEGADGQKPGASDDKTLEKADQATLIGVVKDLRTENAAARAKNQELKTALDDLTKKVNEMTESQKTDAQKAKEKQDALEASAAKVPELQKASDFVKAELDAEMKRIDKLKAEQKKPYTDLLAQFGEDDHLSRLKAVRALKAAEGTRVPAGDEGNPGEPGSGGNAPSPASILAMFDGGLEEGILGGMVPLTKK